MIKESGRIFLLAIFLIGAILIVSSLGANHPPQFAIASSTSGEQTVIRTGPDTVYKFQGGYTASSLSRMITVISTGEVRKDGLLTTSGTILKKGDQITLDVTDNASYFLAGEVLDSPPSPWVVSTPTSGDESRLCGDEDYVYDDNTGGSACAVLVSSALPPVISSASGLLCGALTQTSSSRGIRTFSTVCTVNSESPTATLQVDLKPVNYYAYLYAAWPVWSSALNPLPPATLSWTFDVLPAGPPAPILTFIGNPTSIDSGQSSTLSWNVQNPVDNCVASDGWSGSKDIPAGNEIVSPATDTTYTLKCAGSGGSDTKSVTISVNTLSAPLSGSCSVTPQSISAGESAMWQAQASGGTGTFAYDWSGTDGLSGGSQTVTKTYTTAGTKTGAVIITSGAESKEIQCINNLNVTSVGCQGNCINSDFILRNTGSISATIIPPSTNVNSSKTTIKIVPAGGYSRNITLSYCPPFSQYPQNGCQGSAPLPSGTVFHFRDPVTGNVSNNVTLTADEYTSGSDFWVTLPATAVSTDYTIVIKGEGDDGTTRFTEPPLTLHVDNRSPSFIEVFAPSLHSWKQTKTTNILSQLALSLPGF